MSEIQTSYAALPGQAESPSFTFLDKNLAPTFTGFFLDSNGDLAYAKAGVRIATVIGDITGTSLNLSGALTVATTADFTGDVTMAGALAVVGAVTVGSLVAAGGVSLTATELLALDGITPGTAYASKAVILNSSKGITTITSATITTLTATALIAATLTLSGALKLKRATVAALGTDQTDAAPITTGFTSVTGADDAKGVILPTMAAGEIIIIKSTVSNKILKVWPGTGVQINALTATTGSLSLASGATPVIIVADSATQVYTIPLVAS
jgi:hypothetical protein